MQYYRDVLVDKARALIPQVQALMDQYNYREKDKVKAERAWRFGEGFIKEAYEWFDEVEEVYNEVRPKEIIILDQIQNNETDDRCVYEFIKQVDPLHALMKTEAYTVLTQELLTKTVRREIPSYVTTTAGLRPHGKIWRNSEDPGEVADPAGAHCPEPSPRE